VDQTRFDIHQSILQVVSELYMPGSSRNTRGEQFTLTLMVQVSDDATAPLDIYVDRVPEGERNETYRTVDGTKVIRTQASVDPDAERFDIEVILERSTDHAEKRPFVRVSPDMIRLVREQQERLERAEVEAFLERLDDN